MDGMKKYRVELNHPECGQMFMDFWADDYEHAKDQALDAEPTATFVDVRKVPADGEQVTA
jgi:hypothetical protein